ncbi:MAG: hypothetical protein ABIT38_01395 [Gemmatimonadaceae bacterium]
MASSDTTTAINSYITDMLALEDHIEKALLGQIEDLRDDHPDFVREIETIHATVENHISSLKMIAEERKVGTGVAEAVKRAGSAVLGVGAAAIDFVRNEKLPKNIRDDYAAASLATIGYVMLYTTATSLNDTLVANLAYNHLQDYAKATMTLHNIVPAAVVRMLQEDKLPASEAVLGEVADKIEAVWKQGSASVPKADEITGGSRR